MSLITLPNEIFSRIVDLLSFQDQKACMLMSHGWHDRFQSLVLKNLLITTRRSFKQLLSKISLTQNQPVPLGLLIRRLTLGTRVGVSNAEFQQLPIYCPFLEHLDFNPALWKYFGYASNIKRWSYLARFPCMQRLKLTVPILRDTGINLTQLEFSPNMVDELYDEISILSLLHDTPNLNCLKLSGGKKTSLDISISEFESIHALCPRLEQLDLCSFNAQLVISDPVETLPIPSSLKHLRLDLSLNRTEFLNYWAHKYPLLESLQLQFKVLDPELSREQVEGENSVMKESLTAMANEYKKLVRLIGQFDETYFPCDVFLRGMNSHAMQHLSIHFSNFDYLRRDARNFKILMNRSISSLRYLEIDNWDRSWDYEQDVLIPMGKCTRLETLVLSPQPGTLTEFDIDVILDYCNELKILALKNTYNLFVRDRVNKTRRHGLQAFSLEHSMVNNQLFDYLALRCPDLNTLKLMHMTKPYDHDIRLKMSMPNHAFQSIQITGLKLGLRMEDAGFQCNCASTLCSLKTAADDERWYHLYQPKAKGLPKLQRLDKQREQKIKTTEITKQLWEHISFTGVRFKYESKKNWEFDIPFGFTSVQCRSVNEFKFEGVLL